MVEWLTADTHLHTWQLALWVVSFWTVTYCWFRAWRLNRQLLHTNDQLIATNHNLRDANRELRTASDAWMREAE